MNDEQKNDIFSGDCSPSIVLLDVQGRKNPVLSPDRAVEAIRIADALQAIGGTERLSQLRALGEEDENCGDTVLVYYRSHSGRPRKSEIARVAREIAKSEVRDAHDKITDDPIFVTGSRAVAYAERLAGDTDAAAFLCSTTVWYNHNRCVVDWPAAKSQIELFLDDINERLSEGRVSIAR